MTHRPLAAVVAAVAALVLGLTWLLGPGGRPAELPSVARVEVAPPPEVTAQPVAPVARVAAPGDTRAPDPAPSELSPVVALEWAIEGVVLDEDEHPVSGAQVGASLLEERRATTGTDGRFHIPVGVEIPWSLYVTHATFVPWCRKLDLLPEDFRPGPYRIVIVLRRGTSVELHVRDDQGTPVAGAVFLLRPAWAGLYGTLPPRREQLLALGKGWQRSNPEVQFGETNSEGTVLVAGVTPTVQQLYVSHPSYRPHVESIEVPRPQPDAAEARPHSVTITLDPGRCVRGRVVDPSGVGVPGASVLASAPLYRFATCDDSGRFELRGFGWDADRLSFLVQAQGWAPTYYRSVPLTDDEVDLEVRPGVRTSIEVLDASSRVALEGNVDVRYECEKTFSHQAVLYRLPHPGAVALRAGRLHLELVPEPVQALTLVADGYEPYRFLLPAAGESGRIEGTALLVPERALEIEVLDARTLERLEGATIQVFLGAEGRGGAQTGLDRSAECEPGLFRFGSGRLQHPGAAGPVPADQVVIRVVRRGYASSELLTYVVDRSPPPAVFSVRLEPAH